MEDLLDYPNNAENFNVQSNSENEFSQKNNHPNQPISQPQNFSAMQVNNPNQIQKTENNLDLLLRNAEEIDSRTKDLLIANQTTVSRLFPNKMDKLVEEMRRNTVHSAMEFRLNLYKMSTTFRIEALREKYNSSLSLIRAHFRHQVSEFMMGKLMDLNRTVDQKQVEFLKIMMGKYDMADKCGAYPKLQLTYQNQIDSELDGYLNFLRRQIASFESIMDEQIQKFES
ncbi:hypothetical protein [Pedobacter aquatilis]|uniref:hypothetical protein n=1 Tax=Pedobacter aquatilis TaxID=351343 RepID=UPI00292FFC26|nr:hypothetical protein [Pedobacter aquatilis]